MQFGFTLKPEHDIERTLALTRQALPTLRTSSSASSLRFATIASATSGGSICGTKRACGVPTDSSRDRSISRAMRNTW